MNIYEINTTAYEAENFFLMTSLSQQDIVEVVNPIVMAERDGEDDYDADKILRALKRRYPEAMIKMFDEFVKIII
jgi:hypothetical protein